MAGFDLHGDNNRDLATESWVIGNMSLGPSPSPQEQFANTNLQNLVDLQFEQVTAPAMVGSPPIYANLTLGAHLNGNSGVLRCPGRRAIIPR